MKKLKIVTIRQALNKELLKCYKPLKSFLNLVRGKIKRTSTCKLDKAFEEEEQVEREAKVEIPEEPTISSIEEWRKIKKEKELVEEIIGKKVLKMHVQGISLENVQFCLEELCKKKAPIWSILNEKNFKKPLDRNVM